MKKRIISIIIALTLSLVYIPVVSYAGLETADKWAQEGITAAIGKGFVPEELQADYTKVITRAEFCRMAVMWLEYALGKGIDAVLEEKGLVRNEGAFSDTGDPYILAAYALGITGGTEAPTNGNPGKFTPDGQFDRQQAATMIMNTCRAIGADVTITAAAGFDDFSKASAWTRDGINFVYAYGIMRGTSVTPLLFNPAAAYDRQQSILTFNNINLFRLNSISHSVRGFSDENVEILFVAEDDLVIEREKYILYIPKGAIYSSLTVEYFDICIDTIEEITGLSMLSERYTEKISIYAESESHGYSSGVSYINLHKYNNLTISNFATIHTVTHEMAHLLHARHFPGSMVSPVITEGFAQIVCSLANEKIGVANFNDFTNFWLNNESEALFIEAIETDLDKMLSDTERFDLLDPRFQMTYLYGYMTMQYIYRNYGMGKIIRLLSAIEKDPGAKSLATLISSVIEEDIIAAFPAWYHENRGVYFYVESLHEMTIVKYGTSRTCAVIDLSGKYNYIPLLAEHVQDYYCLLFNLSGDVLINMREGKRYSMLMGIPYEPNHLMIKSEKPVAIYLYDSEDRLIMETVTNDYSEFIPDIDYMIVSGECEVMLLYLKW